MWRAPNLRPALINERLFATLAELLRDVGGLVDPGVLYLGRAHRAGLPVSSRPDTRPFAGRIKDGRAPRRLGNAARRRIRGLSGLPLFG
jgi:ABC-2 type transport system ATP-binding protein